MGPLLFLIYINVIFKLETIEEISCYADDTTLKYESDCAQKNCDYIVSDLNEVAEYMRMNKLTLNVTKSAYIHFRNRNKITDDALENFDCGKSWLQPMNNFEGPALQYLEFLY